MRWLLGAGLCVIALLLWAVLGLFPAAPDAGAALEQDRVRPQGGRLRMGQLPEPGTLNPFVSTQTYVSHLILRYTHDPLLDEDPLDGTLRPALAEGAEAAGDGRTMTFTLREDARFDDGTRLTTADVAFTLEVAHAEPPLPGLLASALREIESWEVLDERRITVRLRERHFAALRMTAIRLRPVQRAWFVAEVRRRAEAAGETPPAPGTAAFVERLAEIELPGPATGAYTITPPGGRSGWRHDVAITATRNEASWRRTAQPRAWNLERVEFRLDATDALPFLEAGQLDMAFGTAGLAAAHASSPVLSAEFRHLTFDSAGQGYFCVYWNHARPHLGDRRVRQALTMLCDREQMVATVFGGGGDVVAGPYKPGHPGVPDDLRPWPFDPAAAEALLAAAGFDRGHPLRIELLHYAASPYTRFVEIMAGPMAAAGVELAARAADAAAMLQRQADGAFDGILWYVPYTNGVQDPSWLFEPDNPLRYEGELTGLAHAARECLDPVERAALEQRLSRACHEEQPATFLCRQLQHILLHRRYRGAEVLGTGGLSVENLWVARD